MQNQKPRRLTWIPVIGALGAAACGPTPVSPREPATTAPRSAASGLPSGAPSAIANITNTNTNNSTTQGPAVPESKFLAVAELPGPVRLFPVDGALLVAREENVEFQAGGRFGNWIGVVNGDRVEFQEKWVLEGLWHRVVAIDGTWPGPIEMLAVGDTGRSGIAQRYKLGNSRWDLVSGFCDVDRCSSGSWYLGMAKVGASVVALESPVMAFVDVPRFSTLRGPKLDLKARPTVGDGCDGQKSAVYPWAFGGTSDGTLIAYGSTCSEEAAVEMWKPGAASSIAILPGTKLTLEERDHGSKVVPGIAKDAWLLAGIVFHYDGSTWKEQPAPGPGVLVGNGVVDRDGTLWAVTENGALYAFQGGGWRHEPLPEGALATDVTVARDGTLWVASSGALLRPRRADDAAKPGAPVNPKAHETVRIKKPIKAGGPSCAHNIVVLYGFTKVTPDDYDFPLTRKALKGHKELSDARFVVTKDNGRKFFSAIVPSFDMAKKIVALIEKEVKGSKPQAVCAEPEIIRELKLDLATGEIMK